MVSGTKSLVALILAAVVMSAAVEPAAAISVELAKKCRDLALKAHPYKQPGEPGPGSAQAQRDYFNECVARGGNMPSEPSGTGQSGAVPAPAPPASK